MTDVRVSIGSLCCGIETVLNVELAIAARIVNRMGPGIAGHKVQTFVGALLQGNLQSVVDRVVSVGEDVDVA